MVQIEYLPIVLTGIGITVSILYYTSVLRNANRTREAQLFMQMYNRFNDETKELDWLTAVQNPNIRTLDDFLEALEKDDNFKRTIVAFQSFYEGLGVLVKEGLLNIRYVALMWGGATRMFWDMLGPILPSLAEHWNYPRLWSETAYLCRELVIYMDKHPELAT
jgi:hypothetical protein